MQRDSPTTARMSVSQEREEAAGHSETLRPESAAHSCVQQISKPPKHSDGGSQTHRPPSPVPSCVSMKSDKSMFDMPHFSSEPVPSGLIPPSPVPSCVSMKSDKSMFDMPHFSSEPVPSGLIPPSPVPSCVSMKSDASMGGMPTFSSEPVPSGLIPPSPVPSCVSMKSDKSMDDMPHFSSESVPSGLIPPSPVPSCVSMKSDRSMDDMPQFSSEPVPSGLIPPSPVPSCVSMKSDKSMGDMPDFSSEPVPSGLIPPSPVPSCVSMKSDRSMDDMPQFSSEPVPSGLIPPSPVPSCVSMKSDKSMGDMPDFSSEPVPSGLILTQDQSSCEQVLRDPAITTCAHLCKQAGDEVLKKVIETHKASLKKRFENISEGIIKPKTLLNEIYTELYITEGESEGVNKEHEVWQVESASRSQSTEDTPVNCNDIFKPLPGQEKHIRTVMTKGVAGIGKTVSVQKFILDWTDGVANKDVDFMFPLSFRELNLVRGDDQYSLHRLLLDFHPELKELNDGEGYKDCRVVFIFDGLDESRLTLDLEQNSKLSDVKQRSSVDVLMTSLIQGTLLPSALIWITSRPAAASQIPAQYIDQVTEVRGFNDQQKEEYFRKRISDGSQANRIISHIQASRSLHIMCHIPVFCWIAVTVLQQMLERKNIKDIPKTLTEMFIHFLLIQTTRKDQKYQCGPETDTEKLLESQRNILLKLAELAFKNLENGNLMFYEEDLRECGIDVSEASVYSGMCTEIFKTESVESRQKKVYCFVHLSVQEFLAAVFVFHSYLAENLEALKSLISDERRDELNPSFLSSFQSALRLKPQDNLHVLLKSAVDKALESHNGHLDLFLRFLMGISLEGNHRLLRGLLSRTHNSSKSIKETCQYMKKLNREGLSPERCINLFHCLFEMKDDSMHKEIQTYLSSPKNIKQKLSPAHCSALAHMLLMSEDVLDEIDLKKYNTSDEGRRRLIPAVRCCRKARLAECKLSEKSCGIVAAVLQSPNSLTELDLNHNDLGDSGVQLLSKGLSSPNCKLQTLRLAECKLSEKSCGIVAAVLQSPNSLTELDLSHNDLGDSGVQLLSKGLSSPNFKLQTLRFADCKLTDKSCEIVASVLQSPNSLLQLDLSDNDLGDYGVQLLSKGLSSFNCKIHTLRLSDCLISEKGCGFLASALSSNPSHLKLLDLSYNYPGESGLKLLSARLEDPVCKLEILKTDHASLDRARPRLLRYACDLTLDPNTAHRNLSLSEGNRKVTLVKKQQPYPEHPERFDSWWPQVLCREGLTGRCYWEAEWSGYRADISVAYKSIERKGDSYDVIMGGNAKSWSLRCYSDHRYSVYHNNEETAIPAPSSRSRTVGVYLDWPAGTLSFYSVSTDTLTHLHTFHSTFTEPLYPGFSVWGEVSLCKIT
ncbi:NACHT, LRR and PYD domains-containing protein 3-like isoform X3 [Alosa pseudoharengus]|uniref:NACHT, LRR and PYD domains-containing protein 3-like isoform X3 n=1 Tax=Alosa pseudoharengus TaxID=34774 RepID=UPI003F8A8F66